MCLALARSFGCSSGGRRPSSSQLACPFTSVGRPAAAHSVGPSRAFTTSVANLRQGGLVEHAAASANADATRTAPFPSFGQGLAKPSATCSRAHCHLWQRAAKSRDFGPRSEHRKHNASGLPASTLIRACPRRRRRPGLHLFGGAYRNRRHNIAVLCELVALPRKYTGRCEQHWIHDD